MATLCPLGRHVFGREIGPCPALERTADDLFVCGLVAHPMRYAASITLRAGVSAASDAAKLLVGASTGCDARFNGEPKNEAFYAELIEWDRRHKSEVKTAKVIWRVP